MCDLLAMLTAACGLALLMLLALHPLQNQRAHHFMVGRRPELCCVSCCATQMRSSTRPSPWNDACTLTRHTQWYVMHCGVWWIPHTTDTSLLHNPSCFVHLCVAGTHPLAEFLRYYLGYLWKTSDICGIASLWPCIHGLSIHIPVGLFPAWGE